MKPTRMDPRVWAHRERLRLEPELLQRRTAAGRPYCWWCLEREVPTDRHRWCSQACVDDYCLRTHPDRMRHAVFARDHGVCAVCRTVCCEPRYSSSCYQNPYWNFVHHSWEADHILELALGGETVLANMQTLCRPCHKAKSARLAERLAWLR